MNSPEVARKLQTAVAVAMLRCYPTWLRAWDGWRPTGVDEYYRARYEGASAPWDDEPARVWIGTFRRSGLPDGTMPAEERLTPSREQLDWLGEVSGFPQPERMRILAEAGLVHVELTKKDFFRESAAAWKLVLAAQDLVEASCPDRGVESRTLVAREIGMGQADWHRLRERIRSNPPPANR